MTQQFRTLGRGTISPSGGVYRALTPKPIRQQTTQQHYIDVTFTGKATQQDVDWVANEIDRLCQNHAIKVNVTAYSLAMTLEELTAIFTQATQAPDAANGYATAFHAGTAAVMAAITRHLLAVRADDPLRLKESIIALSVEARPAQPRRRQ